MIQSSPAIEALDYPVDLFTLNRVFPERYPFLLESTARPAQGSMAEDSKSRFDILFAFPSEIIHWQQLKPTGLDFLTTFNQHWQQTASGMSCPDEVPFCGGWFLYLGYEVAAEVETRLRLPLASTALPNAFAARIAVAIINDHVLQKSYVVMEAYEIGRYEQVINDLDTIQSALPCNAIVIEQLNEDDPDIYLHNMKRIKEYIYEGDVFQVNISRQWQGYTNQEHTVDAIYSKLRQSNPSPFAGIARIGESAILSSSPERLVRVSANGRVDTRPIAGTRPRGSTQQDDRQLQQELIANLKERAEHIMLLDLERNDLGRVCQPGTVKVDELMTIEHYAHVQHIVSNVTGRLREGILPGDVLRAVFPGGTITGCPKERCMAIIAELEQTGRGAYTGSMGYVNHDGTMDMNILIRTIVVEQNRFYFRAGAGIVADSVPEHELQETRAKAEGMLRALR